ncbi:MAG: N-acetyltransferase [Clostridia bacterium]|nr:N-acetyltransferase [Clostridia bacterium]
MIRAAEIKDVEQLLCIYEKAKGFMRQAGNLTQWTGNYPSRELLLSDIEKGQLFCEESEDGAIVFCFVLASGEDPTYGYIEGSWLSDEPYGTIHRIAKDGSHPMSRGVVSRCVAFALERYSHLRVDTHADNLPMQRAVEREGFRHCGTIYLSDGSPRMAYEFITD